MRHIVCNCVLFNNSFYIISSQPRILITIQPTKFLFSETAKNISINYKYESFKESLVFLNFSFWNLFIKVKPLNARPEHLPYAFKRLNKDKSNAKRCKLIKSLFQTSFQKREMLTWHLKFQKISLFFPFSFKWFVLKI